MACLPLNLGILWRRRLREDDFQIIIYIYIYIYIYNIYTATSSRNSKAVRLGHAAMETELTIK